MRALHHHHILPLYVWADDAVASATQTEKKLGRTATLRDSEVVTILVFKKSAHRTAANTASDLRLGQAISPKRFSKAAQLPKLRGTLPPDVATPQQVALQPVRKRSIASLHGRHHVTNL